MDHRDEIIRLWKETNMTASAIAREVGVSPSTVSRTLRAAGYNPSAAKVDTTKHDRNNKVREHARRSGNLAKTGRAFELSRERVRQIVCGRSRRRK